MLRTVLCFVLSSVPALALASSVEMVATGQLPWHTRTTVSNDGRFVAYESEGAVLLRDRIAGTTVQVGHTGSRPLISADGSAVAFVSTAGDLVPGQSGPAGHSNLFLFERATGTIQLVSHAAGSPTVSTADSVVDYDLSGDGRWVVFHSYAPDLVAAGAEPVWVPHVYLFDRLTGQNILVDGPSSGAGRPKISADGRCVVYEASSGENTIGIFLYDRVADTTTQVAGSGRRARINADGRWVAFLSGHDVFLWDRLTAATTLVSHSADSPLIPGNSPSHWSPTFWDYDDLLPAESVLSADGRWVAFYSSASDLVPGPAETSDSLDLFLFDREAGTTTRVTGGLPWDGYNDPGGYALSADGSRIAFTSAEDEVVPGQIDDYHSPDLFLYDRGTGATELVSRKAGTATTAAGGFVLHNPHLSADGRTLVFHSGAPDQHEDDQDGTTTVFAHVVPDPGRDFYTVVPCRLLDTRQNGPALASGEPRRIAVAGSCGIPATARAVAVNATVLQSSGAGGVGLHPGDMASGPGTVGFQVGQIRTSNAILALAFDGTGTLSATPSMPGGGTVHLILDVSGWFE